MRTTLYLPIGAMLWAVMATGLETPAAAQTSASPPPVPRASSTLPPRGPATVPGTPRIEPPQPAPSIDTNPNAGRGQSLYPPRATDPSTR